MATIDGRKLAEEVLEALRLRINKSGQQLKLAAILIGDNPASRKFLELKQKIAEKIGLEYGIYELPVRTTEELVVQVNKIAVDPSNHGVIIELPLPSGLDSQLILNAVPSGKDVDALAQNSTGQEILAPAVEAVRIIFEKYNIGVKNKKCVVFGHGLLVGQPIVRWLKAQQTEVTIIDESTANPEIISRDADIIISGVGKPGIITAGMIKQDAIVIDFGYENLGAKMVGDVDFETVAEKASLITPVPGGVGPIVIAAVLKNLLTLNHV